MSLIKRYKSNYIKEFLYESANVHEKIFYKNSLYYWDKGEPLKHFPKRVRSFLRKAIYKREFDVEKIFNKLI